MSSVSPPWRGSRRDLLKTAAFVTGGALLAGCGQQSGMPGKRVTLTQWYHQYGEKGTEQAVQRYAATRAGGIVAPGVFSAFSIFLFRQFYLRFPAEIEEAGRLDSLSYFGVYWRRRLPNSTSITRPPLSRRWAC